MASSLWDPGSTLVKAPEAGNLHQGTQVLAICDALGVEVVEEDLDCWVLYVWKLHFVLDDGLVGELELCFGFRAGIEKREVSWVFPA